MMVSEQFRKSVVFIGNRSAAGEFRPLGTGFLAAWTIFKDKLAASYLITAKHVVDDSASGPDGKIVIRFNMGIAMVVRAHLIIEALQIPLYTEARARIAASHQAKT
jgi:hypothetical protein